jgi:hypothetical protein
MILRAGFADIVERLEAGGAAFDIAADIALDIVLGIVLGSDGAQRAGRRAP